MLANSVANDINRNMIYITPGINNQMKKNYWVKNNI